MDNYTNREIINANFVRRLAYMLWVWATAIQTNIQAWVQT